MAVEGQSGGSMVDRAKRILLEPKAEWDRIDVEPATVAGIFKSWVVPLALIPAIARLIGSLVFPISILGITYRPSIVGAVTGAVIQYIAALVGVFVLALIIDVLAPTFGGTKSQVQAMKVAAYSATASFLAGIFGLVPQLAVLGLLGLYSLYLLYLGLPRLMKVSADKAVAYILAVIVAGIVIFFVVGALTAAVASIFTPRPTLVSDSGQISGTLTVPGGGSVDLGKLQAASQQMQAAAEKMQSGKAPAAVAPAALQGLLPGALGDYKRVETSSEGGSAGGIGGSTAEARYENGTNNINLRVSDIAAAGALAAMGTALNVQSNRQTQTGYEKTATVDGRMTTEKWDTQTKYGEFSVLVGNRFMVEASGNVPTVDLLKGAVNAVGIPKLEAMKG